MYPFSTALCIKLPKQSFSAFLHAVFLLPLVFLIAIPNSEAQSIAGKKRYGQYPILGAGLKRFRNDLRKDKKMYAQHKIRCKNKKFAKIFDMCDFEFDKILNMREKVLGTNKFSKDTDSDRLSDRFEIISSHTNPILADTDGDGVIDGDEVLIFHTNPLIPDYNPSCSDPVFDQEGNTTSFKIPPPNIGNIARGQSAFSDKCTICHAAANVGTTLDYPELKLRISSPPMSFPSNYVKENTLSDIVAFLRQNDSERPGCSATPLTPIPSCKNQYFDEGGNTSGFGIPNSLIGNINRGKAYFDLKCTTCHADRGQGFVFDRLKASVTGPLMNISYVNDAEFADLIAYANRALANIGCNGTPIPSATATGTPAATPTMISIGCANQYFDASGNTLLNQFGIPSPLVGNIGQGQGLYNLACSSCHGEKGTNFNYSQLQAAVTGPLMKISTVSAQQYAHLVAFLNRSSAAQNCGAPTATPTPINDIAAGQTVYQFTCQSCHNRASEFRSLTKSKLLGAIKEKPEMKNIKLSDEQIRVLLIYLHTL